MNFTGFACVTERARVYERDLILIQQLTIYCVENGKKEKKEKRKKKKKKKEKRERERERERGREREKYATPVYILSHLPKMSK